MTTLLIDGDQYVYKATVAVEREVRWDDQNHVLGSNLEEAYDVCRGLLANTCLTLGSKKVRIAFTEGHNFRKDVLHTYKGNRLNTRKPLCYAEVVERLRSEFPCHSVPGLEADDLMGIWQTRNPNEDTIIVSQDKDMKTIPGKLYRGSGDVEVISQEHADYNFFFQTLTGDATDGYGGCPGVGPAGANKLLTGCLGDDSMFDLRKAWEVVVATYTKAGLTEEDALIQARLARILRSSDWDSVSKQPILWSPKND